ncbi:MAG: chorismate-binding protein [Fulvivirga sp.]
MTISEDIKIQPATQVINNTIAYAQQENIPVAIWRHPEEQNIQLIVDFSPELKHNPEPMESKVPGFIFAPYDTHADTYLIKADLQIILPDYQANCKSDYHISAKADAFFNYLDNAGEVSNPQGSIKTSLVEGAKENFMGLVEKSVDAIKSGTFQKVVLSRRKEITFDHLLNIGENFIRLTENYPSAFVSLVYVPQTGLWLGATPELLISVKGNTFKTVALAGTQQYEEGMSLANVAWTQKEIEEQALVCRYIINCFKKIRLREYEELGPKTIVAGNLLHLNTAFKVDMEATNFNDLGEIMLKLLHPTSAICGMPLEPAKAFLAAYEKYDREYFSGYLGPANFAGDTTLYVNLRCMHIQDKKAIVFAGAGVTEDSQPEKEWNETEIKMNTLLKIIR